jgi:hypothetical protein
VGGREVRPRELSDQERAEQVQREAAADGDPDALRSIAFGLRHALQRLDSGYYDDEHPPEKRERVRRDWTVRLESAERDLEAEEGRVKILRPDIEDKLLTHLSDNEGGFTADELGRAAGLTRGHVRGILDDLSREGEIYRNTDLHTGLTHYSMDPPEKPGKKPK